MNDRSPILAALALALSAVVIVAPVYAASSPDFKGTPTAVFSSVPGNPASIGVVVRLTAAPERQHDLVFYAAPRLRAGDEVDAAFGGNPASRVGKKSRNCYVAEAARPEPRSRVRNNSRWRLGLSTDGETIIHTTRITLKRQTDEDWQQSAARALGCL